jgi:hypothetical protein
MQEVERSAASVEEAIESALEELGISEQEAEIEVVQEPRTGFLRLNAQLAVVRVRRARPQGPAADAGASSEADATTQGQADVVMTFLEGLLDAMGIDADVEFNRVENVAYVDVWAPDEGRSHAGGPSGAGQIPCPARDGGALPGARRRRRLSKASTIAAGQAGARRGEAGPEVGEAGILAADDVVRTQGGPRHGVDHGRAGNSQRGGGAGTPRRDPQAAVGQARLFIPRFRVMFHVKLDS